jgi:hypothetical protein
MLGPHGCPAPSLIFVNMTEWSPTEIQTNDVDLRRKTHAVRNPTRLRRSRPQFHRSKALAIEVLNRKRHSADFACGRQPYPHAVLVRPATGDDTTKPEQPGCKGKPDDGSANIRVQGVSETVPVESFRILRMSSTKSAVTSGSSGNAGMRPFPRTIAWAICSLVTADCHAPSERSLVPAAAPSGPSPAPTRP